MSSGHRRLVAGHLGLGSLRRLGGLGFKLLALLDTLLPGVDLLFRAHLQHSLHQLLYDRLYTAKTGGRDSKWKPAPKDAGEAAPRNKPR